MRGPNTGDRGQALPLVALQLWLIVGVVMVVVLVGERAVTRARAQTAADAAALAASSGADAGDLAHRNGALLERLDPRDEVDVVVSIGEVQAAARAGRSADAATRGLDPRLVGAIAAAEVLLGEPVPIVSGFRSRADQERLWAGRGANPYPVAPPGTSLHERGLAIDVPAAFADRLAVVAEAAGLCRPLPATDPVHFVLCGS